MTAVQKIRGVSALGVMALMAASAFTAQGQQAERYSLADSDVAVFNLAGDVQIRPGSGSEVVVEVMRGGRDADQLDVQVGSVGGQLSLRVIYPGNRVSYGEGRGSTTVRVRDDGTFYNDDRGGRRVQISRSGRGLDAFADLVISVPRGTDISLYLAVGEAEARGLEGSLHLDMGSGAATVSDIDGRVNVDTGSGSVDVSAVRGDVNVDTGSGGVRLSDISGDRLVVDTGSGGVRGSRIVADQVAIDTGSGSVELGDLSSPDIAVDTGSGSVELDLMRDVDRLVVDTGSGGIRVTIPDDLGAEVELDTGSGGIDVDVPVQVREARRSYLRGSIGDGDGFIELDTGSGGIRLIQR